MTVFCVLFADLEKQKNPIIISDVLLTEEIRLLNNNERYKRTYIPSIGGIFPQIRPNISLAGMVQKTYILDETCCVTFAGNAADIVNFYQKIKSQQNISQIISCCNYYKDKIQFSILFHDTEKKTIYLCATDSCRVLDTEAYGKILIGGSGESTLRELLIAHQNFLHDGTPHFEPIARALFLVNAALELDEINNSKTLGKGFGAYYEISIFLDPIFVKLDCVSHHYMSIEGADSALVLKKSYYHEYIEEDLIVRRVTYANENNQISIWQDCYVIKNIESKGNKNYEKYINSEIKNIEFEVISIKINGNYIRLFHNRKTLIKTYIKNNRWFIGFDEDILIGIRDKIENLSYKD